MHCGAPINRSFLFFLVVCVFKCSICFLLLLSCVPSFLYTSFYILMAFLCRSFMVVVFLQVFLTLNTLPMMAIAYINDPAMTESIKEIQQMLFRYVFHVMLCHFPPWLTYMFTLTVFQRFVFWCFFWKCLPLQQKSFQSLQPSIQPETTSNGEPATAQRQRSGEYLTV